MSAMAGDGDADADVPWGRYAYALDGLATGCYLEGAARDIPGKRRLRFRVELPARCFVTSVALRLSHGASLHDITIERTLNSADFVVVHDGSLEPDPAVADVKAAADEVAKAVSEGERDGLQDDDDDEEKEDDVDGDEDGNDGGDGDEEYDDDDDEDHAGDAEDADDAVEAEEERSQELKERRRARARTPKKAASKREAAAAVSAAAAAAGDPTRKTIEVRRAADNLRLIMTDLDDDELARQGNAGVGGNSPENNAGSGRSGVRVLAVSVIGYTRGQTPPSKGLKVLLNVSTKLIAVGSVADRAEADGLLGLAFLGNRRYRQAAELLRRAADLSADVAREDAKLGFSAESTQLWAAQLNLLAAHAFFEHVPLSNDGVAALLMVAAAGEEYTRAKNARSSFSSSGRSSSSPRDVRDLTNEFLDLRTELLSSIDPLMTMLVLFLGESKSLAARMASAHMIEFVAEQLGCAISPYLSSILNCVLRSYKDCKPFGPRDRPAANSFSYDSMEDCYERLIDTCCKMLSVTEHTVVQKLFNHTVVPIFQEAFKESDYLYYEEGVEENCDEVLCTAVAQTLRVSYLVLNILEGDAHVPSSFVGRILNMLISENGIRRTPTLLRRTALHTWDAVSRSLTLGACGMNVMDFKEFLVVQREYIGRLVVQTERPSFEYCETDDSEYGIEVFKENVLAPHDDDVLKGVLAKRNERTYVIDRFTLKRLLDLIQRTCVSLQSCADEDAMLTSATVFDLQRTLARATADLLMSSLVDVSYHEACLSGNGHENRNNHMESGTLQSQLRHSCAVLEELLRCFWGTVTLLPSNMAAEAERCSPVRHVLAWCADRMKHSAPPAGMLKLLTSVAKGLRSDLNRSMHMPVTSVNISRGEATFIHLYRSQLTWLPQATAEDALELCDTLAEIAAADLMAEDILRTVDALSDQSEELGARADISLDRFASLVADTSPRNPELALKSLQDLANNSKDKQQRLAKGFPISARSGSFSRRIRLAPGSAVPHNPMMRSFYLHVVLVSCFNKFDALIRLGTRDVGPSYVSEQLDSFVEHAALLVRALNSAARDRLHREYMSSSLGDIFGTCLTMQDHVDGRVRLAGFEIFSGALDVLFLAQKQAVPLQTLPASAGVPSEAAVPQILASIGPGTSGQAGPAPAHGAVGSIITELGNSDVDGEGGLSSGLPAIPSGRLNGVAGGSFAGTVNSTTATFGGSGAAGGGGENECSDRAQAGDAAARDSEDINTAFMCGGPRVFRADSTALSHSEFEDSAWQNLCAFMTNTLGVGTYVDFVVQRACLEYLKGCLLNALRGRSNGASVLSLKHVEQIWDSVMRLVGSPWRTLNALSFWVSCAVVNVGFFVTVTSKGRQSKIRASQLEDFALNRLFPAAEKFLRGGTRETRLWGARLLEVYLRARDMNPTVHDYSPAPPPRIMRQLDSLCHDWCEDVRDLAKLLRDIYIDSTVNAKGSKASSGSTQSFTQSSLSVMKRQLYRDSAGSDSSESLNASSKVQLWFPPLPKPTTASEAEVFSRTLEAFANAEVAGGEDEEEEEEEEEQQEYYEEEEYDEDDQYDEEEVGADKEEDAEEAEVEDVIGGGVSDAGEEQTLIDSKLSSEEEAVKDGQAVDINAGSAGGPHGENLIAEDARNVEKFAPTPSDAGKPRIAAQESNLTDVLSVSKPGEGEDDEDYEFTGLGEKISDLSDGDNSDSDSAPDSARTKNRASAPDDASADDVRKESPSKAVTLSGDDTLPEDVEEDVVTVTNNADPLADLQSSGPASGRPMPLGLDVEEKMPGSRLRRKGSFTSVSRSPSSSGPLSGEGEGAPRLGRRRSTDTSLADQSVSGDESFSEKRPSLDAYSPVSGGRRKALLKLPVLGSVTEADGSSEGQSNAGNFEGGLARRKSERDSSGSSFASPKTRRYMSSSSGAVEEDDVMGASTRVDRAKPAGEDTSSAASAASSDESISSSRPKPRRLPRAPAFVKGDARLPRPASNPRISLPESGGGTPSGRPRVPRTKGARGLRLPSPGAPELDRKGDRSHRVGRRDFKLSLDEDGLGLDDDDLFGDFDPTLVEEDVPAKGTNVGRRGVGEDDEMPQGVATTPKRRSSQRILDSVEHFSRRNVDDSSRGSDT